MIYDAERRAELDSLHQKAGAKLEQVLTFLGGDLATASGDVGQKVAARMEGLTPGERRTVQIRAAVAYAELRALLAEMNRHLDMIASDMSHTTQYSNAAQAYRRTRSRG